MVLPGLDEERGAIPVPVAMEISPKRSNRLHNFTLPCLKWGNQRYLRCSNATGTGESSSGDRRSPTSRSVDSSPSRKMDSESESNRSMPLPKINCYGGDGIEAMRQKLMFDLKTEADKMKDAILRNDEDEEKEPESPPPPPTTREGVRAWNLRTRRAECKSPFGGGSEKEMKIDEKKSISPSPARTDGSAVKLPKLRSNSDKTRPRPKFSIQLTKKEIEEDFMKMVGHRPPRRPIKRPKAVQKHMDTLFPGLWLTEVTPDMYKVPEETVNGGKARQSGKGKGKMHLAESDDDDDES